MKAVTGKCTESWSRNIWNKPTPKFGKGRKWPLSICIQLPKTLPTFTWALQQQPQVLGLINGLPPGWWPSKAAKKNRFLSSSWIGKQRIPHPRWRHEGHSKTYGWKTSRPKSGVNSRRVPPLIVLCVLSKYSANLGRLGICKQRRHTSSTAHQIMLINTVKTSPIILSKAVKARLQLLIKSKL